MTSSIDSRLMSFGELLTSSNSYVVPPFQRNYSWTEIEVEQLWVDVTETLDEGRSEHFLGAIVVNNSDKPKLKLIDGQQRLSTISILMCVLRDIAKKQDDAELAQVINNNYIGALNLRTRNIEPKLELNSVNNQFYQTKIVKAQQLESIEKISKNKSLEKSNLLIARAYLKLYKLVWTRLEKQNNFTNSLIEIEECIRDKVISIIISVSDEANSYLIFETLNDRGLELSVSDLLKNYFFSRASGQIRDVQAQWNEINFAIDQSDLTKFIRHFWLSREGSVTEKTLYRKIASSVRNSHEVVEFVNQLREAAETYGAFHNPESPIWNSYDYSLKLDIETLDLFNVSQCYCLLLAAKETLSDKLFTQVVRMVVVFSFRYNIICGFNPNRLDSLYSETAKCIRLKKTNSIKYIFSEKLKAFYPSDQEFKDKFSQLTLSNKKSKLARYILGKLNSYHMNNKEFVTNPNAKELNLEHILPQKPTKVWLSELSKSDYKQYVHRLGNMTLLESVANRKIGNKSFQEKSSTAFASSKLPITQEILHESVWGAEQIDKRQKRMADAACHIWRLDY